MASSDAILTVEQVQAAERAAMAAGSSVDDLMRRAGEGAAEWVWRVAAGRGVTVLCGPGNNGGDGYVLAEHIRQRGGDVRVVAPLDAKTGAAMAARDRFGGPIKTGEARAHGGVFVDCLFGSGLARPLADELSRLLTRFCEAAAYRVAVDLPSGVDSDSGALLGAVPRFDLTLSLAAWKWAHFLMPAQALMGERRLVPIGVDAPAEAARVIGRPRLSAPPADTHKYRRGLLAVLTGEMPGAALLGARAAQHSGAGYVKVLGNGPPRGLPADIVHEPLPPGAVPKDERIGAFLVGPGLGRSKEARGTLQAVIDAQRPTVIDADALHLFGPDVAAGSQSAIVLTPHEGEQEALEKAFDLGAAPSKPARAAALARASGAVVVAKGADTIVAAPDGRLAAADRLSSWLSTAGTGDVLSGIIASRLASGVDAFDAACEGVWLHGRAAGIAGAGFSAGQLAAAVRDAFSECQQE